jgi:hypothetical protein
MFRKGALLPGGFLHVFQWQHPSGLWLSGERRRLWILQRLKDRCLFRLPRRINPRLEFFSLKKPTNHLPTRKVTENPHPKQTNFL